MEDSPDDKTVKVTPQEWTEFLPTVARSSGPAEPVGPVMDEEGQALPNGTRLGEFEVVRVIGLGGFGIVYEAWDHSLERTIALKEFMPSNLASRDHTTVRLRSERHRETFTAGLRSFVNEARSLASFDHPALVKVYRFWEANGTAYMAMPLYKGPTLKKWLQDSRNTVDEHWVISVLAPLTEALALVHDATLVHRDISPDNIILVEPTGKPLLLDFGAARKVISDMSNALTVILKPSYAPVEQYGEIPGLTQGPWTDVYSLAATMHFAMAGKTPPNSVGRIHADTYTPLVQAFEGRFSERLLRALDHALAVLPKERLASMGAFRQALGLDRPAPAAIGPTQAQPAVPAAPSGAGAPPTQAAPSQAPDAQTLVLERRPEPEAATEPAPVRPVEESPASAAAPAAADEPAAFAFPRPGDRLLERFRIGELVISDGAHQGFRALDEQRNVEVLLQVLNPQLFSGVDASATQERLTKRCALCSGLNHAVWSPHFELLAWNEARLIVSEFRAGRSLRVVIQESKRQSQPVALDAVRQLALALADGLQTLHTKAVHAGLSPDAIVVGLDGRYRVLGIGLGGVFSPAALQAAGGFGASQVYQAPEGLAGATAGHALQLDGRADQYSLAAIVFELLAGKPRAEASEALHALNAEVPVGVSQAVSRAMSPSRDARFDSLRAFLDAWAIALGAPGVTGAAIAAGTAGTGGTAGANPLAGAGGSAQPHQSRAVDALAPEKPTAPGPGAASESAPRRSRMPWLLGLAALALVFVGITWVYVPQVMEKRDAVQQVQAAEDAVKDLTRAGDGLRRRYEAEKNAAETALDSLKRAPQSERSEEREEWQRQKRWNERSLLQADSTLNRFQSDVNPGVGVLSADFLSKLNQALRQDKLDDARTQAGELRKSVAEFKDRLIKLEEQRAQEDLKRVTAFVDELAALQIEGFLQFDETAHRAVIAKAKGLIAAGRYDEAVIVLKPAMDALLAERSRQLGLLRDRFQSLVKTDPDSALKLSIPTGRLDNLIP
jgi:serine/threonine protein kinase